MENYKETIINIAIIKNSGVWKVLFLAVPLTHCVILGASSPQPAYLSECVCVRVCVAEGRGKVILANKYIIIITFREKSKELPFKNPSHFF